MWPQRQRGEESLCGERGFEACSAAGPGGACRGCCAWGSGTAHLHAGAWAFRLCSGLRGLSNGSGGGWGGDEELGDLVGSINALFPADVVAYCRPEYGLGLVAATRATLRGEEEAEKSARGAARAQLAAAEGAVTGGGEGGAQGV